ncbi:SCRG1 protein, partial [Oenanthe oenanthe]|nr:SCRG1 protein [Oenanthe oenanthe]
MKMVSVLLLLLSTLQGIPAVPSQHPACYKRPLEGHSCHSIPGSSRGIPGSSHGIRHVPGGLQDHFWEGKGCEVICYCNLNQLLCCPKDIFFGTKISFLIPCNRQ